PERSYVVKRRYRSPQTHEEVRMTKVSQLTTLLLFAATAAVVAQKPTHMSASTSHVKGAAPATKGAETRGAESATHLKSFRGIAASEFQMSCTINQRPFSFTQRTMYFPESAAGSPGGRLAVAGQPKCQRPSSSACGPLAQTDSAHTRRMGGGLDMEFIVVMKARIASRPCTGAMLGGSSTPFA